MGDVPETVLDIPFPLKGGSEGGESGGVERGGGFIDEKSDMPFFNR